MRDARVPHRSRYHTRQRTHRSSTPRQIRRRAGNGESSGDLQGAALRTPGKAHHVGGGCVARRPDRSGTTGGCRPSPPDRSPLQPVIERSRDLASIRTGAIRPAHCARRDGRGQTRTWNASGEVASPCGERCDETEDALRVRNEITDLNGFLAGRMNRVVPVAMKGVGGQLDACHLLVGHHHAHGILAAVDL